jgi:hypothetical protein
MLTEYLLYASCFPECWATCAREAFSLQGDSSPPPPITVTSGQVCANLCQGAKRGEEWQDQQKGSKEVNVRKWGRMIWKNLGQEQLSEDPADVLGPGWKRAERGGSAHVAAWEMGWGRPGSSKPSKSQHTGTHRPPGEMGIINIWWEALHCPLNSHKQPCWEMLLWPLHYCSPNSVTIQGSPTMMFWGVFWRFY